MTVEDLNSFFGLRFSGVKCPGCGNFIEFNNGEKLGDLFSDSVYLDISCNDCGCAMEFNGYGLLNEFSCQIDIPSKDRWWNRAAESVGKISLTDLNLNYEAEKLRFSPRAKILARDDLPLYFEDHSDIDWHSDMADFDVVFKIPNLEAFCIFKPAQNESKTEDSPQKTPKSMSQTNNERTCVNLKNKINLFGTTMEFGPNNDPNLVCTMLGVAVKTDDGSLHVYDKKKKKIINTGNMKLGDFPIFLMPDTKVKVGEMIKRDDGKYCFVEEVCADGRIKAIAPKESEVRTLVPVENLLGWKLYTKVVCLLDSFTGDNGVKGLFGDGDGIGKMLMVAAMMSGLSSGTTNDYGMPPEEELPFDMQSLMPFLLLSESGLFGEGLNFSGESTPFKSDFRQLLLLSSMMNPAGEGLNFLGGGSSPLGLLLMMKIMSKDKEQTADADSTTGGEHRYDSGKGIQLLNPSESAAEEHKEEPGESPGNDSEET